MAFVTNEQDWARERTESTAVVKDRFDDRLQLETEYAHYEVSSFATLAALKADGTKGDGHYTGPAFAVGTYVTLADGSTAHYKGGVWATGPMT